MTESENEMAQFKLGTWQVHVSNTVTAQTHHQHAAASGHTLLSFCWLCDMEGRFHKPATTFNCNMIRFIGGCSLYETGLHDMNT